MATLVVMHEGRIDMNVDTLEKRIKGNKRQELSSKILVLEHFQDSKDGKL